MSHCNIEYECQSDWFAKMNRYIQKINFELFQWIKSTTLYVFYIICRHDHISDLFVVKSEKRPISVHK